MEQGMNRENVGECAVGRIFNVQHYSIHDGPGIRTTVFLKGCPLRCWWCANPESQFADFQHMYRSNLCVGCGACIQACPKSAIRPLTGKGISIDFSTCTLCGKCVEICPNKAHAMAGKQCSVQEVFDEVAKDALFYGKDGGITLSGGEPMEQADFSCAILAKCRDAGFTTAVETSGFAPWPVVERIAKLTDIFLYDIKVMDHALHQKVCGQSNEIIHSNLQRLSDMCDSELIVRTPVIGGCNDTKENMRSMGAFIRDKVKRCCEVQLLPYHNLGEDKYTQLGVAPDQMHRFATPTDEEMEQLRNVLRDYVKVVK